MTDVRPQLVVAGLAVAGGIHLGVAALHRDPTHLAFFLVVGMAQTGLAVLLARRQPRLALVSAAVLSALVAGVWALTRAGLATHAGPAGLLDAVATAAELVTAAAAVAIVRRACPPRRGAGRRPLGAALAVLVGAGAVVVMPPPHHHAHPEPAPVAGSDAANLFGDLFDHHAPAGAGHRHPR